MNLYFAKTKGKGKSMEKAKWILQKNGFESENMEFEIKVCYTDSMREKGAIRDFLREIVMGQREAGNESKS